jgi:hypothetical protein
MKIPLFILAGALALAGCQRNDENGFSGSPQGRNETADSTGVGSLGANTEKLVKKADLRFEVADVQQGSQALDKLARGMGGTLRYLRLEAEETGSRSLPRGTDSVQVLRTFIPKAQLTLLVPAQQLQEFLYGAAQLSSFLRYSELQIDDQTLNYLQAQWRNEARQKVLAHASERSRSHIDSAGLAVMDDIIDNRVAQRSIDGQVRYSTISLELSQAPILRRSVVVNSDLDAYSLPFGQRMGAALAGGWRIFEGLLLAGAQAWTLLLLGLGAWIAWRKWGRRNGPLVAAREA